MGKLIQFPRRAPAAEPITTTSALPQPAEGAPAPVGLWVYYPEMGDKKPPCQIQAYQSGGHYYLSTSVTLKGRGVKVTPGTGPDRPDWHEYTVTNAAFDKLKTEYSISLKMLLD